ILESARQGEAHARQTAEAPRTFGDLPGVDVRADRFTKVRMDHSDKRPVPAAIVEQASASVLHRERAGKREPAAMAPRDDAARAVDLFAGVVAVSEQVFVHNAVSG